MHFQHFTQVLAVSTAMFFGTVLGNEYEASTTSDVTTTMTTTITSTTTSTEIVVHTKTREAPCPTAEAGILNFDNLNLNTTGVSPMPAVYEDFSFSGSAGWQYFSSASANSTESRGVSSQPNALLSRSYGLVSFGSKDHGFSFDLKSLSLFGFASNSTSENLHVQFKLVGADNSTQTLYTDIKNSAPSGGLSEEIDLTEVGDFTNLIDCGVAVWQTYDNTTGEGNPAVFVLDDIEYIKRQCTSD